MIDKQTQKFLRELAEIYASQHTFEDEEIRKQFFRDRHKGKKAAELARAQFVVQSAKDYLDDLLKLVNAEFDVIRIETLPEQMEQEGLEGFRLEGVGRITLTGDAYVKIVPGQADALFKWLRKQKLGDLIKEGINPSTLKAFAKARVEAGKSLPEGCLNVTPFTRASITKS